LEINFIKCGVNKIPLFIYNFEKGLIDAHLIYGNGVFGEGNFFVFVGRFYLLSQNARKSE
jgi:hypothetical protein